MMVTRPPDAGTVTTVMQDYCRLQIGISAADAQLLGGWQNRSAVKMLNPAGFLVLCYYQDGSASALQKDVKRLLKISKQG